MKTWLCSAVAIALALELAAALAAKGLVIEREDEAINRRAPADDPGWANVGICNRWTAVYLGNGWVLTAAHVGPSHVELEGTIYQADVKSRKRVVNADGTTADLMLFRIHPEPALPPLTIASESPPIGTEIVLIGSGLGRGETLSGEGRIAFAWRGPAVKRWGTSMLEEHLHDHSVGNTDAFATRFSIAKTEHEAIAAHGDSGGAAFAYLDGRWQLVGIILAVDAYDGQPDSSAAYGNRTLIADLARYAEFIRSVTGPL